LPRASNVARYVLLSPRRRAASPAETRSLTLDPSLLTSSSLIIYIIPCRIEIQNSRNNRMPNLEQTFPGESERGPGE
jgi:hypothetical protein